MIDNTLNKGTSERSQTYASEILTGERTKT